MNKKPPCSLPVVAREHDVTCCTNNRIPSVVCTSYTRVLIHAPSFPPFFPCATCPHPCRTQAIFKDYGDLRMRMATLARLWNVSSEPSRHAIFSRFLDIITGETGGVSGGDYAVSDMKELPIKNYEDLPIPENLLMFYGALPNAEEEIRVFEALFVSCSEREKTLVIQDLRFFFQQPEDGGVHLSPSELLANSMREQAAAAAAVGGGEGGDEDGGEAKDC